MNNLDVNLKEVGSAETKTLRDYAGSPNKLVPKELISFWHKLNKESIQFHDLVN